jgi:uncharacterized membrane protein YgdD (TMEM256/DUF423 family)
MKKWIKVGALGMALSVILGAFGAHALKDHLSEHMLQNWQTGVHYQMVHALGILIVSLLMNGRDSKWLGRAALCFSYGVVFFSGSLYVLALTGALWLGAITPIGGLLFILGWIFIAWSANNTK